MGEPKLLLLDEPTVGLDPIATQDFYRRIEQLKEQGCTVILCSHVLPGVEKYIDRALILGRGKLLAEGSVNDLRQQADLPATFHLQGDLTLPDHLAARANRDGVFNAVGRCAAGQNEHHAAAGCVAGAGERRYSSAIAGRPLYPLYRVPPDAGGNPMSAVFTVANKEFHDGLRNRWVLSICIIFAVLAIGLAYFGAAAAGKVGFTSLSSTIVSLASLAVFIIPLIALMLAYDGIVGEDENGTLLLLMTYPLSRWQLLLGKMMGQGAVMAFSTLVGFGSSAVMMGIFSDTTSWGELIGPYAVFIFSAMLLGWIFIAIAYVISASVSEKSKAAGVAPDCVVPVCAGIRSGPVGHAGGHSG